MASVSVLLLALSVILLSLPGFLLSNTSNLQKTKSIYIFSTLSASVILSFRLAGADTTRYLDIYELCSQGNANAAASFLDLFTPLLCKAGTIIKYPPVISFIHFFIALLSLYAPPVFDKKLSDSLHPSFFRLYPLITSITVLLGYFLSPHRQAAASILFVYYFLTKSPLYLVTGILFHFNSGLIVLFMYPFFDESFRYSFFRTFKRRISFYSLVFLFLFGLFLLTFYLFYQPLLFEMIERPIGYLKLFLGYTQNLSLITTEFGSIFGSLKLYLLIIVLIPVFIWITNANLNPYIKLYMILSFIIYPFGTAGRIALPALLFASYYYCTLPFTLKPHLFFIALLLFISLAKAYPTVMNGRNNEVTGWLHQSIPRDYFNAYELHYLYD